MITNNKFTVNIRQICAFRPKKWQNMEFKFFVLVIVVS